MSTTVDELKTLYVKLGGAPWGAIGVQVNYMRN